MTREEARAEIRKVFEPAFANYIITALEDGATPSDKESKTGKWVIRGCIHNMYTCYACSECGRGIEMYYDFGNIPTDADVINEFPYCHCGAKMEVDE